MTEMAGELPVSGFRFLVSCFIFNSDDVEVQYPTGGSMRYARSIAAQLRSKGSKFNSSFSDKLRKQQSRAQMVQSPTARNYTNYNQNYTRKMIWLQRFAL